MLRHCPGPMLSLQDYFSNLCGLLMAWVQGCSASGFVLYFPPAWAAKGKIFSRVLMFLSTLWLFHMPEAWEPYSLQITLAAKLCSGFVGSKGGIMVKPGWWEFQQLVQAEFQLEDTLSVELTHGTGETFIFKAASAVISTVVLNSLYFKLLISFNQLHYCFLCV